MCRYLPQHTISHKDDCLIDFSLLIGLMQITQVKKRLCPVKRDSCVMSPFGVPQSLPGHTRHHSGLSAFYQ